MTAGAQPPDASTSVPQSELATAILASYPGERKAFEQWLAATSPGPSSVPASAPLSAGRQLQLISAFLESREDVTAEQVPTGGAAADSDLAFRIGPDRVFHLGAALKIVLIDGLGLFFAFATTSGLAALFYSWFFLSGADMVRRFMRCFEKISDPEEKLVFTTLYELQNRRVPEVAGDDPDAGPVEMRIRVSVSADSIAERLAGKLTAAEVRALLRGMAARDIVTERRGLWSISFW
jgi:hypothetical protein